MKPEIKISDNRLELTRYFDAPRDEVFAAWADSESVQQWWVCAQTSNVESTIDFRTGGEFSHVMTIEGCGEHTYAGQYEEIIESERIVTRFDINGTTARVTVQFYDEGERTKLVLVQEGFPQMPDMDLREIVSQGFTAAFERLDKHLAGAATGR